MRIRPKRHRSSGAHGNEGRRRPAVQVYGRENGVGEGSSGALSFVRYPKTRLHRRPCTE